MRSPKQFLAARQAQKEYAAQLETLDRQLDAMDAAGVDPASPAYYEAWCDRMSYAANRYPGAPPPEADGPEPEAEREASL